MNRWQQALRQIGLGKLLYRIWFLPRQRWNTIRELGGWRTWRAMRDGERRMREAVPQLPVQATRAGTPLTVYFLTGDRFWHQSAFCAWSLQRASGRTVVPHFLDDGSLRAEQRQHLDTLFPGAVQHSHQACLTRLHAQLPTDRYPRLNALWHSYPNIRKLIDPHLLGAGWKLVLDSDMLFFSRPDELLDWFDQPTLPLHMVDAKDAYGYPAQALEALSGARLPARVNVGVTGLRSDALDFAELERWCDTLIGTHGKHYFLEQALIAAWIGRSGASALPAQRYRLLANRDDQPGLGCMDHYVALAKPVYFLQAWPLSQAAAATTA